MKNKDERSEVTFPLESSGQALRRQAEDIFRAKASLSPENLEALSTEELRQSLYELRVHQIELEMQNEELRRAQSELDAARARYFDLYDLAPVGYFTINEGGQILEANLTAAMQLGTTRNALVKLPITRFILKEDQDIYYMYRKRLIKTGMPQECELRMLDNDGTIHWAHLAASAVQDVDGAPVGRIVMSDITERKLAEDELRESEERFRKLFKGHSAIKLVIDSETGSIIDANEASAQFYGWPVEELKQMRIQQISLRSPEEVKADMKKVVSQGAARLEFRHRRADGTIRDVEVYCNKIEITGKNLLYSIIQDITERKLGRTYGELGREVLQILNERGNLQDSIQRVLTALKTRTGLDAVGIRLQAGDDFPYFAQEGFSKDFLLTENMLIKRDADGGICQEKDISDSLECTCGLVISGKTDPTNPLFTLGGSCWTNDSSLLLDIPPGEDPRLHPHNQCIHQGYASVALVPIRDKDRTVGLIQLNDRRKGCFTLNTVELLEGIASHIGAALMRKRVEEALRETQTILKVAMDNSQVGIAIADAPSGALRYVNSAGLLIRGGDIQSIVNGVGIDQYVASWQLINFDGNPLKSDEVPLARAIMFGETCSKEFIIRRTIDDDRIVLAKAAPIMDDNGKIVAGVVAFMDITERKHAEENLRASLAEKEVLLKEVHHRVKNNLQVISSLISLQADSQADEQLQGVLSDVRNRVRTMALVHEKLHQTENLARLDFAEYAHSLLEFIWSSHDAAIGNKRLNMSLSPLILPIEMAVLCGLIVNELASNAIKHAFPSGSGGEVTVTLEHDTATGAVCLHVRDNGVGLPADLDWRQSPSLGLRLVKMLAKQMRGTVQTGPGPGTEFQINFKVKGIIS
jgi:PAS domain S-box-containing protein